MLRLAAFALKTSLWASKENEEIVKWIRFPRRRQASAYAEASEGRMICVGVKKKEKPQRAIGTMHSQLFVEVISDGR